MNLAVKVDRDCTWCRIKRAIQLEQKMGDLPAERVHPGTRPFSAVCLDFLGPTYVKSMVNKRTTMKAWPIIMVCQATGAVHVQLSHNYGTQAFLLQWEHFIAIRGNPSVVVSDKGSQLTSASSYVNWSEEEDPSSWDWEAIEVGEAGRGTEWRFVPTGGQY